MARKGPAAPHRGVESGETQRRAGRQAGVCHPALRSRTACRTFRRQQRKVFVAPEEPEVAAEVAKGPSLKPELGHSYLNNLHKSASTLARTHANVVLKLRGAAGLPPQHHAGRLAQPIKKMRLRYTNTQQRLFSREPNICFQRTSARTCTR